MYRNTVRNLVQSRMLANIFQQNVGGQIALKGGMAMRACYGVDRYTQDIDLAADPNTTSTGRVRNVVRTAFKDLQKTGAVANARVSEPKQTDTVQRWRFNGDLGVYKDVNMTVEVSRRDPLPAGHVQTVSYELPHSTGPSVSVYLDTYDKHALADSKIACLCSNREEPRDLLDLNTLFGQNADPIDLLRDRGPEEIDRMLHEVWDRVEKLDWNNAYSALEPVMPNFDRLLDGDEWESIQLKIGQFVHNRLELARAQLENRTDHQP